MAEASFIGGSRAPTAEPAGQSKKMVVAPNDMAADFRAELLIGLDLFVRAQRALRGESSAFTRSLGRIPDVLGSLTQYYRVDIARATRNQLLVVAVGEGRRNAVADTAVAVGDRVTIDENFRVNSNFPFPVPPRDYLYTLARVVMNRMYATQFRQPDGPDLQRWEGVFRGYFQYEVRPVSAGGRTIVAVGLKAPVQGDIVEMQPGANLYEWVYAHRNTTGIERELHGELEKIYLAERIYQEHAGFYASTFKSLLPVANSLAGLSLQHSPMVVQEFQLDPTFGFHAEVAQRDATPVLQDVSLTPSDNSGGTLHPDTEVARVPDVARVPAGARAWSVNGYGQIAEVATVERIVDQFEQARKKVATHGEGLPNLPGQWQSLDSENPLKEMPSSQAGLLSVPPSERGRKPLLIDAVEGDK